MNDNRSFLKRTGISIDKLICSIKYFLMFSFEQNNHFREQFDYC